MKSLYIFLLGAIIALLPNTLHAVAFNETDANLLGHVVDKKTNEHIPFVTIALKGTTIGTTTDDSGHYFLKNLPEGTFTIEVSCIGYQPLSQTITIEKGKNLELNFSIEEQSVTLNAYLLAFVSGIMVYISFDELLPGTEKYGHHHWGIGGVIAGMAVMAGSLLLL